ncbi:DUF481 domain-containing protein [Seongchinamella sediminis]|nr:DUF481 domain-containing protein [Seongchinamella sediminis]
MYQTASLPRWIVGCSLCVFSLLLALAAPARADRLHFSDGESITGALVGISDGQVQWSSAILGDLAIGLNHVAFIESGSRFDLKRTSGELNNCWMFIQREKQHLHCDQGVVPLADWTLVVAAGETITLPQPLLEQKGSLILALEDASGNTDVTRYDINARSELRFLETRHTLAARYQDESTNGQKTRQSWLGTYQYDQFFTEQWFATGNAAYEENEFRDLEDRTTVGLGMGYQFLETAYFDLLGKSTLNYVNENLTSGENRERPAFLWNLDFAWRVNDQGMEVFHRHAALQSFQQGDDWELATITGLKYPINGAFSSVFQLEYNYDNLPAESEIDKVDRKWSIGVNYDW